jgi:hypothetical protein
VTGAALDRLELPVRFWLLMATSCAAARTDLRVSGFVEVVVQSDLTDRKKRPE